MNNNGAAPFTNGKLAPAVLTDFDDTAAAQNVAEMLLHRFGDPTWQQVRARFRAGELSLKDYQEITFNRMKVSRVELQNYVKQNASLRPYFGELWRYCQRQGFPLVVVSHGLDFYIEALLEQEGFPLVPVYAVKTEFTPQGITYRYLYTRPGSESLGNFKCLQVEKYRQMGHHVIYIGDGRSDFCPASKADTVFAHSVLAEQCQRQQIPFHPFRDFQDVLLALQERHQETRA